METTSNNYLFEEDIEDSSMSCSEKSDTYIVERKTFFHTEPDEATITKQYLIEDDYVFVSDENNNFGYVEFKNSKEQTTKGWIKMVDLYNP